MPRLIARVYDQKQPIYFNFSRCFFTAHCPEPVLRVGVVLHGIGALAPLIFPLQYEHVCTRSRAFRNTFYIAELTALYSFLTSHIVITLHLVCSCVLSLCSLTFLLHCHSKNKKTPQKMPSWVPLW